MEKHKHYECIVAWAEGKEVEYKNYVGDWKPVPLNPSWDKTIEYRIADPLKDIKQAHAEGKTIEYKHRAWYDWSVFDFSEQNLDDYYAENVWKFRVQTEESKYIPYTFEDAKDLIGKTIMLKCPKVFYTILRVQNGAISNIV